MYDINLKSYRFDLLIIMFGTIWYSLYSLLSSVFIAMRKNIHQVVILIIVSILSYLICTFLILHNGLYGASWAYFIIMLVQLVIYIFVYVFFTLRARK